MARRLLESLSGTGAIHANGVLLRTTQYELSLWSDDQPPASDRDSTRVASIDGHIDITGIPEATVLAGAETLTLTIDDGRRLAFQLTSTGGSITAPGWLPE
jgi:hypothetical protein